MHATTKIILIFLVLFVYFGRPNISMAGIAAPWQNPQGTWHPEFDRLDSRILLFNSNQEDAIKDRILYGEPIFGALYSSDLAGRFGLVNGIYQKAIYSTSDRTGKAIVTKAKAFVYLMNLNGSLQPFNDPNERENFKNDALLALRTFDTGVGGSSQVNQLQIRAKELICYLEAYDMLRSVGALGIWDEDIARRLCQFTANIYYNADYYSRDDIFNLLARNNHRIIIGSALGMAAILLGEWGSTDYNPADRTSRSNMPFVWISYAMIEINSVLFDGTHRQVFPDGGYNEGPHYLKFSMAFALPFFKAMKNLGEIYLYGNPHGDFTESYSERPAEQDKYYELRSPWFGRINDYKPDLYSILEWITKIRQPDGRLPAIADTYYDSYFAEAAIFGSHYFWPVTSFDPDLEGINMINWSLQDFMENRIDFIAAGNLPVETPQSWQKMQVFPQTGEIVFRSGWDFDEVYFHLYARDYVYSSLDYDRNTHLQNDNSSFMICFNQQVVALDCGYISYERRGEVDDPDDHNLILVDYTGPSKTETKAQILQTLNEDFYKYVKINTNYSAINLKRNVIFCDEKYFIINDQMDGSQVNRYSFVIHGNDSDAVQLPQGALWQVENAMLLSKVTSRGSGPLTTNYVMYNHDFGFNKTRMHKVLAVQKDATDTQFLSVHFPYHADVLSTPEIIEISGVDLNAYPFAGFYIDRTSDIDFGNRYEFVVSQWPANNTLQIQGGTYGNNDRSIAQIETDAVLLVLSFDPNDPDDPNLIEIFSQNMTLLNYGGIPLYPNHPPQLNTIDNQTMNEGEILDVPIFASDPNHDYITFSVNNMPTFGQLIDNGDGSGLLRFTADYSTEGNYDNIEVIAGDDEEPQLTDIKTFNLQVGHVNQLPTAVADANIKTGTPPLTINFSGSASHDSEFDPDGFITHYTWEFGDGINSDLEDVQHTYTMAGKFSAKLTVTDNEGAIGSDTVIITNNADLNRIYISEVSDANPDDLAFLELYNNADYSIDLTGCMLIEYSSTLPEDTFYFGIDENPTIEGSTTILPNKGLMVIARGVPWSDFEDEGFLPLPEYSNFNAGNRYLNFNLSKRWQLMYFDQDNTLIDNTLQLVGGGNRRDIQVSRGLWKINLLLPGTPGRLEPDDQSLPVTLSSFQAIIDDNSIVLKWQTKSELNNLGFIIQKRQDQDSLYKNIASYESDEDLRGMGNSAEGKAYTYIDKEITPGITYWYKLMDVSIDGVTNEYEPIRVKIEWNDARLTPISSGQIPKIFALHNNYPNPFNSSSIIVFDVPESEENPTRVMISIYDILGRKIRELFIGYIPAGRYQVRWDGKNQVGEDVPSGVFIYTMRTPSFTQSKKMVVLR